MAATYFLLLACIMCAVVGSNSAGVVKEYKKPAKFVPLNGEDNYHTIVNALKFKGQYTQFLQYLNKTGIMVFQLNTAKVTVFAPTNAAFHAAARSPSATAALSAHFLKVVMGHLSAAKYKAMDLTKGLTIPSLASVFSPLNDLHAFKAFPAGVIGNSVWAGKVTDPDIVVTDEIAVHGVNAVLIPLALQH